jgi:diguanylate cyclase (GGDEF)-like protein/putative nucleotidyltransferase with HDIG domain
VDHPSIRFKLPANTGDTGVVASVWTQRVSRSGREAPGLHESALAVRSVTPALAARAQAIMFAAAAVVGALGVLIPHPPTFDEAGLLTVQATTIVGAVAIYLLRFRMPSWLTDAGPFIGAVVASTTLWLSGSSASPYVLFYLWIVFYAFYFLPRRAALALAVFTILNYVAVMIGFRLSVNPGEASRTHADIPFLVLLTGTIAVAGTFIVLLRERVGRLIRQLTDAAATDPLTGLANRRELHRALEIELERSQRGDHQFTLILGDADFFKHLNDRLGHHAGDDALRTIASLLTTHKRRIDLAARIGGEEFAVLLPETGSPDAFLTSEKIRSKLREAFAERPVPLTMSFGIAAYPQHGRTADALLRAADEALYAAKALGRDRSVVHSSEIAEILESASPSARVRDDAHLATVLNLAEALDVRDTGTAQHSQTVGHYSKLMARELSLAPHRVERLRIAGVLHDIGKIGVPDAILRKPGKLTDEEWEHMRRHPETGARILGGSGLDDIREWVLAHHERPDGRGYPHGLKGSAIPLEARILAVADAYEAMTADRVYRKALGPEIARTELNRCAGTQFDADVVAAFLRILDQEIPTEDDETVIAVKPEAAKA